ncbi:MAG: DEAD/DEAH box helicase [Deltaproteobacteria bacterium]|nr:DEAD/DEAH box helicase [Deltaproteobacteria bacterium]
MVTETTAATGAAGGAPGTDESGHRFEHLPLSDELRQALREMNYEVPTPVQWAIWEPAVGGRDLVVQARTGTGKTAAFGMPIVDRLIRRSQKQAQALVLCPTRELALQVCREIELLGKHRQVGAVPVYGGASMPRQIEGIAAGAQIVVGTPGRVLDHLRRETLDPTSLRILVLDEADEMLSMGFERELTAIIEHLPAERQTLLFSATIPPDIERLARTRLRKPEFLILSGDHVGALEVQHYVYFVSRDKTGALLQVLEVESPESALVFCNTREQTARLAQTLVERGYQADWLNGDLPQSEREQVMERTRRGQLRFLVATDVAARGIDLSHLTHVINFDFPQDTEGYIHRTGRTGRAGRTGTALSLVTPQDIGALYYLRLTYKIRPQERQLATAGEQRTRLETDLVGALVESYAPRGRHPDDLALARRLLTHDEAPATLAGLLRELLGARPELGREAAEHRRGKLPAPVIETPRAAAPRAEPPRAQPARAEPRRAEPRPAATGPAAAGKGIEPGSVEQTPGAKLAADESARPRPALAAPGAPSPRAAPPTGGAAPRRAGPEQRLPSGGWEEGGRGEDPARGRKSVPSGRGLGPDAPFGRVTPAPAGTLGSAAAVAERVDPGERTLEPARPRRTRRTAASAGRHGHEAGGTAPSGAAERQEGESNGAGASIERADPGRTDDAECVELHLNVGRLDGARTSDVRDAVLAAGGLEPEAIKRVRLRAHYAFVDVPRERVDAVLGGLRGTEIASKAVVASVSQRSRRQEEGDEEKDEA